MLQYYTQACTKVHWCTEICTQGYINVPRHGTRHGGDLFCICECRASLSGYINVCMTESVAVYSDLQVYCTKIYIFDTVMSPRSGSPFSNYM